MEKTDSGGVYGAKGLFFLVHLHDFWRNASKCRGVWLNLLWSCKLQSICRHFVYDLIWWKSENCATFKVLKLEILIKPISYHGYTNYE